MVAVEPGQQQARPVAAGMEGLSEYERSLTGLRRSAGFARVTGDPAADSLAALLVVLESFGALFRSSEASRLDFLAKAQKQAEQISEAAIARVRASEAAVVQRMVPEMSKLIVRTVERRLWTVKLQTLAWIASAALVLSLVIFSVSYAVAYKAGRNDGVLAGRTISTALSGGTTAALTWSDLMAANDSVAAMKVCRQKVLRSREGRRYCAMPVWLDVQKTPQ